MATKPVKPMKDRLEKLRDRIKNIKSDRQGFWSPKDGTSTVIRILPEVGTMEYFFQQVGRHHFPPEGKKSAYCLHFTTEGEEACPICEYVEQLHSAGDVTSKKMAEDLKVRRTFWMNIVVRGRVVDGQKVEDDTGPFIFTPGIKVMQAITQLITDPDYGDILDVNSGLDITIKREGSGLNTEYSVTPRRKASPLSANVDQAEKWLDEAQDLSVVKLDEDPDNDKALSDGHAVYILPYNRLVEEFGLDSDTPTFLKDDEEDEEPVATPSKSKPISVPSRKPKAAVEEDVEEDEVLEEDEDEPPAKKEVERRKLARRPR